ncbi:hypothetical protein IW262DRAFT_556820 [Armillaria fumosa]|nr:hypothetical protein IW262DRAFT_556820 [Armillaria fumosa]
MKDYANVPTPKHLEAKRSPLSVVTGEAKPIPQSLATRPALDRRRYVYDAMNAMRSAIAAPVDSRGCDSAQLKEREPRNQRFTPLISLMLSSQTKDELTNAVVKQLRAALGGSISVQGIIDGEDSSIVKAIAKVEFWRRKTQWSCLDFTYRYLLIAAQICQTNSNTALRRVRFRRPEYRR